MKIQLTKGWQQHKKDEVVEVNGAIGRALLEDGYGKLPEPPKEKKAVQKPIELSKSTRNSEKNKQAGPGATNNEHTGN